MPRVCFDHLSGSPVEPAALEAMLPWFREKFAGTGAVHSGGVEVRTALDAARDQAAVFLNATSPEEIIFTSSGTEALNLAIKGCALANQRGGRRTILLSAIEHPAVAQSAEFLESLGFKAKKISVTHEGQIDLAELASALDHDTLLICAHAAHHDLGTIQNVAAIGELAAERGIAFLLDATYAAGWMPLDAQATQASYIALAPHRFGGPKGVGILYKQRRARLAPILHGGAQELGYRAGTENIPGIIGAGVACELAARALPKRAARAVSLQQQLWKGISERIENVRLNGPAPGATRLPNSLNISFAGLEGEALALALDMKGIAITSGQACVTKANKIPATFAAIGCPEDMAPGTVIFSFGPENTNAEVDQLLQILPGVVAKVRDLSAA